MIRTCLLSALGALAFVTAASADVIVDWNNITASVIKNDIALPVPQQQLGPGFSSRNYAMVHAAMYDAVNSVSRTHEAFRYDTVAAPGTSAEAAAVQAAYKVLVDLYPTQQTLLDVARATSLAAIPDSPGKAAGVTLGDLIGADMSNWRASDHAHDVTPYVPGALPGMWRPDPLSPPQQAWGPGWGLVTPFAIESGVQFRGPAPPALNSPEYAAAFEEVKRLGSIDAETLGDRTADQTEIGVFWGYDRGGLGPPPILYNQITQTVASTMAQQLYGSSDLSLQESARLFALVNLAQADAGVACWDTKFLYNFWRPVTAIREAGTDGNAATIADPGWIPLGAPDIVGPPGFTPPFPAYGSGHATFGAATFKTLENFFGTDSVTFTIGSDELPGVFRTFNSFSEAAEENGQSRIYLGIHWSFDKEAGIVMGNQVGDYVFDNYLQPVPEPSTIALGAMGGIGAALIAWRRRRRGTVTVAV